jgi:TRAP-type C4-dicarboxylate transport system substrate-binding protein
MIVRGLIALLTSSIAFGEPVTLRFASIAPDGTSWARELRAMGREVEESTKGELRLKWYLGGIVGDETEVGKRIERGQIDGTASGGILCGQVTPSILVEWLPGLIQTRDEAASVTQALRPDLEREAAEHGYRLLATSSMGPIVIFSRTPVRDMAGLKATKLWLWDLGLMKSAVAEFASSIGLQLIPTPIDGAARAYEEGRTDGFLAIPSAALAFQWSTQARYVTNLWVGFLPGCLVVSSRSFDRLPPSSQKALTAAMGKYDRRFEELGKQQDDELLGGLFQRQGLKPVPVSESFRASYFDQARQAREKMSDRVVPRALLEKVTRLLADFRAQQVRR